MNKELQKLKQCYIPLYANGAIGLTECAKKIGITTVSVWRLAKRYKKDGAKVFIHGHTGKPSHNLKLTQPRKITLQIIIKTHGLVHRIRFFMNMF